MTRVCIMPNFSGADRGDGGIRRVVEAQQRWLPSLGIELVTDPKECDVLALHAGTWPDEQLAPDVQVVAHCHGLYWEGYEWHEWCKELNKEVVRTLKQSDAMTAPSEWVAQALRRGMWADPTVLYHGIEPDEWPLNTSKSRGYVLWNKTRVDPICDPTPVNRLAELAPDVPFVSTFGEARSNMHVSGVAGYYDGAKTFVQEAGVYLATSRETFGIGTLEAMVAGVPVLGWNWGGQAEIITHKEHGYLAELGNYQDLLEGLRFCIANRAKLGKAGRAHVLRNFTWKRRIKPYASIYKQLAEQAKNRPRVSVVITNYNLGRYVTEAVRSTYSAGLSDKEVEVVLVDDASTEPLPEEIVDLAVAAEASAGGEVPFKLIRNAQNLYLSGALNVGAAAARGKYVVPLDADNLLEPGSLKTLADALDYDRALDIAYGKMRVLKDDGSTFVSDWPPESADLAAQARHHNQVSSTAMYRRRVWQRVGGYRRRCHTAEDADFWSRALALGFAGRRVTDAVAFTYRDRDDSMSHTQRDWAWHHWYRWSDAKQTRSFAAGGENIPTHSFPLVSVIIPVGPNHRDLVLDALDSLQAQTFRHWEAIVINDTGLGLDCKLPPGAGWVPPWTTVLALGGGVGAATARNFGLSAARAPYVLFLDADDYLHPECLEHMYETITTHGGFVYSDWFVAETGEAKTMRDFDPEAVLKQLPFSVTCMYSRQELQKHRIRFDESFNGKGWEDWDFAIQVVARAGICGMRIPMPLFHYRMRTGALRDSAYKRRDEMKLEIRDKWVDYYEGRAENMGCGGCGGRRYAPSFASSSAQQGQVDPPTGQAAANSAEPTTLLEYVGDSTDDRSFLGQVSGVRYVFGDNQDHKVRRVYSVDAPGFLSTGFFKQYTPRTAPDISPLQASGPPIPALPVPGQ